MSVMMKIEICKLRHATSEFMQYLVFSLKTEKKLGFNYNKDDYWVPNSYYVM